MESRWGKEMETRKEEWEGGIYHVRSCTGDDEGP